MLRLTCNVRSNVINSFKTTQGFPPACSVTNALKSWAASAYGAGIPMQACLITRGQLDVSQPCDTNRV